jgi:hypothetical protein
MRAVDAGTAGADAAAAEGGASATASGVAAIASAAPIMTRLKLRPHQNTPTGPASLLANQGDDRRFRTGSFMGADGGKTERQRC